MSRHRPVGAVLALAFALALASPVSAITFAPPIDLGTWGPTAAWPGSLKVGADGTLHAVFAEGVTDRVVVEYRRSKDDGRTWAPPYRLAGSYGTGTQPAISVVGTTIDVVWADGAAVYYRRSGDSGRTWQRRKSIAFDNAGVTHPQVARGANGRVYVTYGSVSGAGIVMSEDGGLTFPAQKILSDGGIQPEPVLALSGTRVHVAYLEEGGSGESLVRVRSSVDSGASWGNVRTLTTKGDRVRPSIAASGATVVVAFGVLTTTGDQYVVSRKSTDIGVTWAAATAISSASLTPSAGPVLTYAGGTWYAAVERCATNACLSTAAVLTQSTTASSWPASTRVSTSSSVFALPEAIARTATRTHVLYTGFDALESPTSYLRSGQ